MRILGLDIGDKRIGVAISDPDAILSTPLTTIFNDGTDRPIDSILQIINEHGIKRVVIGLPYTLEGSAGHQAEKTRKFVSELSSKTDAEIHFRDERLSTIAAERMLKEAGLKRDKIRERRDAAAAAYILQGYIDNLKMNES
jgi:putative Holliday junction resolvase